MRPPNNTAIVLRNDGTGVFGGRTAYAVGGTSPNAWNKFIPAPWRTPTANTQWNERNWPREYPLAPNSWTASVATRIAVSDAVHFASDKLGWAVGHDGVVLASSDLPEVVRLSDRVLVLREGKLAGTLEKDTPEDAAGVDEIGTCLGEASELRFGALDATDIGEFSADDLLGEIFSRFCIGK